MLKYAPGHSNSAKATKRDVRDAGYGHMASWYFGEIFAHPRVRGLDYYARLDTDSKVTSPIRYDLFAFMRDNGFSYGCGRTPHDRASASLPV